MTHLADKLKLLASSTSEFAKQLEDTVDAKLAAHTAKKSELTNRINDVFAKTDAISADADAGLKALEDTLNQLSNS